MKRSSRVVFAVLTLVAGVSLAQTVQSVHPNDLRNARSFELGELLLLLMPDAGQSSVGWDFRADSPIVWKTDGYKAVQLRNGTSYVRNGIVRVNVQGKRTTVLKQRVAELGWTVSYSTSSNPGLGPEEINVTPGTPSEDCFGAKYDGCDFDEPLKSLAQAGITTKALCSKKSPGTIVSALMLTHPGKRPTLFVWETSGGSGGSSASVTLKLVGNPDSKLCE